MNDARMPLPGGDKRRVAQLQSIADRLASGSLQTGDLLDDADRYILTRELDRVSIVVNDGAQLLRLILERLAKLAGMS